MDCGFQVLDSSPFQWNLDSGFQSLVGFRNFFLFVFFVCVCVFFFLLYFGFQRPDFWIPESLTLGEITATVGEAKIATGALTKKTHLRTCINPFCTPLCRH